MRLHQTILTAVIVLYLSVPALAQVDLSASWASKNHEDALERGAGPNPGDFTGIPFNDSGRAKALAYSQSELSMPERICAFYSQWHMMIGTFGVKIWNETDSVTGRTVAWVVGAWEDRDKMTIWMDGRPHPSEYAPHTWMGFSTGVWDGNMLTVTTTHIKQGWERRENIPASDEVTLIEHYVRHGDLLSHISVVDDPVYLAEPLVKSQEFRLNPDPSGFNPFWPCEYIEEGERQRDQVPSYFAGENPWMAEYAATHDLPQEATMGGPETMYPEYRARLKQLPKAVYPPKK